MQAAATNASNSEKQAPAAPTPDKVPIDNFVDNFGQPYPYNYFDLSEKDLFTIRSLWDLQSKQDEKNLQLKKREMVVKMAEEKLEEKARELTAIQEKLQAQIDTLIKHDNKQVARLVKIYENMKPDAAAEIFNTLPQETLLSFVSRMREMRLAPILARMNVKKAQDLTAAIIDYKKRLKEIGAN